MYFLRISTTCLVGIILVESEIRRGLGLDETLHGRNSLWAKPAATNLDSLAAAFADVLSSLNHHIAVKPVTPETVAENRFAVGKEEKETLGRPRFDIPAEMW